MTLDPIYNGPPPEDAPCKCLINDEFVQWCDDCETRFCDHRDCECKNE